FRKLFHSRLSKTELSGVRDIECHSSPIAKRLQPEIMAKKYGHRRFKSFFLLLAFHMSLMEVKTYKAIAANWNIALYCNTLLPLASVNGKAPMGTKRIAMIRNIIPTTRSENIQYAIFATSNDMLNNRGIM